ncbi:MAG: glycerol-3-phosphate 1-O-acyltransferase PlsY [Phycisphaerae bacterium]|nr:glycerol-3-phosphate 1-O-acyltransferase PlsY [Phycisphaerae bacterium]
MPIAWQLALLFIGSYLLGGVPFGLVVARLKGVDIRKRGSGNVGATNVGRVLGRKWGVLVLVLDATKGALTTVLASVLLMHRDGRFADVGQVHRDLVLLSTGVCCVIGSIAPVYLRFRGGKGVATSLGVVLGIYPYLTLPGLAALAVWAIVVLASRYVSLGSIAAACVLPVAFIAISWFSHWPLADHYPLLGLCLVMSSAVLLRHRGNMGRLLSGTESRIGGSPS